jgi:polyhydroxyalkanoate synthesis repressor PhaR
LQQVRRNMAEAKESNPMASGRLIKKYPNRRLYDTRTSAYITLADVKELVLKQEEFQVIDAKTGEDLTRSILLQIILEEENGGHPMFTSDVLSQFIRVYGNAMQGMMGGYLERNIQLFTELQKRLQEQSQALYGNNAKASTDLWNQFMSFQGPAMQGLISAYMEQSRNVFLQMQQQLQSQTRNMFTGFGFPGFPGQPGQQQPQNPPGTPEGEKKP